jgi:putative glycosyltransferase (TIGR04372 family)
MKWLNRQIVQINKGGWSTIRRKIGRLYDDIRLFVFAIWAIPGVLFIRLIRPYVLVRMAEIFSSRIGHFSMDATIYLNMSPLISEQSFLLDLYSLSDGLICNSQWKIMVQRRLKVYWWVKYLIYYNRFIPGGEIHERSDLVTGRDYQGFIHRKKFHFMFYEKEDEVAKAWLREFGWIDGEPFICLAVRDSKYLAERSVVFEDGLNANAYHNYRDGDIDDYVPAVQSLLEKGYWVIRMGKSCFKQMPSLPRVIDYPFVENQNDLLDIWLSANCDFFISTGLGIDSVASSFRRPQVFVNALPIAMLRSNFNSIWAPKHLTWKDSGKYLTLREHWIHRYQDGMEYEQAGILVVDLTSDEITNIILEREQRNAGIWIDSDEDLLRQKKFWDTFTSIAKDPNIYNEIRWGIECIGWAELEDTDGPINAIHGWKHPEARVASCYLRKMGVSFYE